MSPVKLDTPEQDPALTHITIRSVEFVDLHTTEPHAQMDVLWGYENADE